MVNFDTCIVVGGLCILGVVVWVIREVWRRKHRDTEHGTRVTANGGMFK